MIQSFTSLLMPTFQLQIKFKSKSLYVIVPESYFNSLTPSELELKEKLQSGAEGAELFDRVVVDECTWSIEKSKTGSKLTITLVKGSSRNWSTFLK